MVPVVADMVSNKAAGTGNREVTVNQEELVVVDMDKEDMGNSSRLNTAAADMVLQVPSRVDSQHIGLPRARPLTQTLSYGSGSRL